VGLEFIENENKKQATLVITVALFWLLALALGFNEGVDAGIVFFQ